MVRVSGEGIFRKGRVAKLVFIREGLGAVFAIVNLETNLVVANLLHRLVVNQVVLLKTEVLHHLRKRGLQFLVQGFLGLVPT